MNKEKLTENLSNLRTKLVESENLAIKIIDQLQLHTYRQNLAKSAQKDIQQAIGKLIELTEILDVHKEYLAKLERSK